MKEQIIKNIFYCDKILFTIIIIILKLNNNMVHIQSSVYTSIPTITLLSMYTISIMT